MPDSIHCAPCSPSLRVFIYSAHIWNFKESQGNGQYTVSSPGIKDNNDNKETVIDASMSRTEKETELRQLEFKASIVIVNSKCKFADIDSLHMNSKYSISINDNKVAAPLISKLLLVPEIPTSKPQMTMQEVEFCVAGNSKIKLILIKKGMPCFRCSWSNSEYIRIVLDEEKDMESDSCKK